MSINKPFVALVFGLGLSVISHAEDRVNTIQVQPGETLAVQVEHDTHMKVGEAVRARTVYPFYVDNQLVIPAGSELIGKITALKPAPKNIRTNAKLSGDFTPLHQPEIAFDDLLLAGKNEMAIQMKPASNGMEVVRFQATGAGHQSMVKKLWSDAVGREKETVHQFTAPGKKDRARRMLYSELPYHPELLTEGTEFSVETAAPIELPVVAGEEKPVQPTKGVESTVTLAAELVQQVSSGDAIRGTKVEGVVTQPLFGKDQQLKVPEGSRLLGEITQVHAAGKWGKGGVLRFSFRELQFPAGFVQKVQGTPVSVDSDQHGNLQIDAEGGVKPGSRGMAAPLIMGLLAASAVHENEASVMHTGGASNGFALIGRATALAVKSPYVGAAFGFYGTGRAIYSRFIAHGQDVTFPKHTRIEVALDPQRMNDLKPVR